MATLAQSFLQDLEDLSDDDADELQGSGSEQGEGEEGEEDDQMDDIEALNYDDLSSVARLIMEKRYHDIMERVRAQLGASTSDTEQRAPGSLEDDPTYKLLVDCNRLAVDIDNEIAIVHNFIRDKYRPKFPELESLIHHPIDYAKVVQRVGNEMDLTLVNLEDIMPAATIMVLTVTATTTSGKELSQDALDKALAGCEMAYRLDGDKRAILEFVESRMNKVAPNLSALVGSVIAARLMGVAGGLLALSRMPACNVEVLGQRKKVLAGMSTASSQPHRGFISQAGLLNQVPPSLHRKTIKLLATKATLLARVDAYGQDPSGGEGQRMHADVLRRLDKLQEPPPAKQIKPLPRPDEERKKRRGGRRLRKMKERYGLTDMRKAANRLMFNFKEAEEEYIDGDEVIGLGTLGKDGSGRLRMVAKEQKQRLSAKAQKKMKLKGGMSSSASGMGTSNGLASTLAFTPVQGIELTNPNVKLGMDVEVKDGTMSYFSEFGGFRSIKKV